MHVYASRHRKYFIFRHQRVGNQSNSANTFSVALPLYCTSRGWGNPLGWGNSVETETPMECGRKLPHTAWAWDVLRKYQKQENKSGLTRDHTNCVQYLTLALTYAPPHVSFPGNFPGGNPRQKVKEGMYHSDCNTWGCSNVPDSNHWLHGQLGLLMVKLNTAQIINFMCYTFLIIQCTWTTARSGYTNTRI